MKEYNDYVGMTRRYLKSYNQLKITVENLTEEIEAQQAMLNGESVAIAHYGDEPGSGMSELYTTERAASRRMKLEDKIEELTANKAEIERILRKIDRAMDGLDSDDRELVRGYYIEGYSWKQLGINKYYTEKWAGEKGNKALKELAFMLFGVAVRPKQLKFVFVR